MHDDIDALVEKAQQAKNDITLFDFPKEEEKNMKDELIKILKTWKPSSGGYYIYFIIILLTYVL